MSKYKETLTENSEMMVMKSFNESDSREFQNIEISTVKEGGLMFEVESRGCNGEGYGIDYFSLSMSEEQARALHGFLSKKFEK